MVQLPRHWLRYTYWSIIILMTTVCGRHLVLVADCHLVAENITKPINGEYIRMTILFYRRLVCCLRIFESLECSSLFVKLFPLHQIYSVAAFCISLLSVSDVSWGRGTLVSPSRKLGRAGGVVFYVGRCSCTEWASGILSTFST